MKLSLIQITVGSNPEKNFEKTKYFLNESLKNNPDFILLPECFLFISNSIKIHFSMDHEYLKFFQEFSKINKTYLLLGSLPIEENNNTFNRSILINENGEISSFYDKIHMFDVNLRNNETYRESDTFKSGSKLKYMNIFDYRIGHSICFDLRFPKLYRDLAKKGCKAIVVPSAFTYTTGKAHWHTLLKARAIENGVFIIAPNQWGINEDKRSTYGHSMIVNPWGEIIAEAADEEMVLDCDINFDIVEGIQNSIPVLNYDIDFN